MIWFIYAFDQSDSNLFVKKIWCSASYFFSKNGPEVQATLIQISASCYLHDRVLDCATIVMSGKVGIPLTGLTTLVWWLSLPQLTVLSRSAIVV